jgi:hypothetical protein
MTDINAIKARLGSISREKMESLPPVVQRLLEKDLPDILADLEPRLRLDAALLEKYDDILAQIAQYEIPRTVKP